MSDHPKGCYLLFKGDGSGLFPMCRTNDGRLALLLFTSSSKAQAFSAELGMSQEWQVAGYTPIRFVEWVREAVKRHGAAVLAIDPDPSAPDGDSRVIPVIPFLIELEADLPPSPWPSSRRRF